MNKRKEITQILDAFLTRDAITIVLPYCYPLWLPDQHYSEETLCFLYLYVPVMFGTSHPLLHNIKVWRYQILSAEKERIVSRRQRESKWSRMMWQCITDSWAREYVPKVHMSTDDSLIDYVLSMFGSSGFNSGDIRRVKSVSSRYYNFPNGDDMGGYLQPPLVRIIRIHRAHQLLKRYVDRWKKKRPPRTLIQKLALNDSYSCVVL